VVPTRHGRTGWLFTASGRVLIKQARYAKDERPIDPACCCPVCRKHSRAYLHHLFGVKEMLGVRLNTLHNLYYFADLMRQIRSAIAAGSFAAFRREFYAMREAAGVVGADDAADRDRLEEPAAMQEGRR
jgi:queuine tRNA-ribosyltransferase